MAIDLLHERLARIRLLVLDVDGVLTDGRIYIDARGCETKAFHTRDGHGLKRLMAAGIEVGVISGRESGALSARMDELGVRHVFQGYKDKAPTFETLIESLGVAAIETAYIGDDILDLPVMKKVGLAVAVRDCHPAIRAHAHLRTARPGGHGAAREICDLLLAAHAP